VLIEPEETNCPDRNAMVPADHAASLRVSLAALQSVSKASV